MRNPGTSEFQPAFWIPAFAGMTAKELVLGLPDL
jgi:hypothetical protein